jgi:iron(III) transport system substrate-binding protein
MPNAGDGSKRRQNIISRSTICIVTIAWITSLACQSSRQTQVIVYVSEDQVFSEPVLKDFERETRIVVRAVLDTEEAKSTGVMNRLIAEKDNPQADVYWATNRFAPNS